MLWTISPNYSLVNINNFTPKIVLSSALNTQNAVIGRDRFDCCNSDLIFINLLAAKRVSIGTTVELAWADAQRVPVIVRMEATGNPHDSVHVRGLATYLVNSLDEGIAVARCFFNAPVKQTEMVLHCETDGSLTTRPWIMRRDF